MGSKTEERAGSVHSGDTTVSLVIPSDPTRFLIARSVVTAVAAQLALPIDTVEDARLAVTECCNLLLALGRPDHLRVRAWTERSELALEVSAWAGSAEWAVEPPTETFSWVIVSSLAETTWFAGSGGPSITTRWPIIDPTS